MEQWFEGPYMETVIQATTGILVVGFIIFGIWTMYLKRRRDKRWQEMAILTLFSLLGAVMMPLIHQCAYQLSFVERLGIVTFILTVYAGYKYYTMRRDK